MALNGRVLNTLGLYGGRLARRPYGQDMLLDIQRLAAASRAPIRTILDVGANVGQSALHFSKVFRDARILSFEPHPQTFSALQAKIAGQPSIAAFNLAMGDSAGEVDFFEYDNPLINSRIADAAYPQRKGLKPKVMKVSQQTLDGFCTDQNLDRIDFLKIDTEGFESAVISGASQMLADKRIRFISCEFVMSDEGKTSRTTSLAGILDKSGYTLFSTYFDYVIPEPPFFGNGNALFIPPLASLGALSPG
jgi:FkbM family methyltransferase